MRTALIILMSPGIIGCSANTKPERIYGRISQDYLFGLDRVVHSQFDIDHDGTPEKFLGSTASRGNAGMSHLVLRRDGNEWIPIGEIFFHPKAFRVLPLGRDGNPRLLRYWRLGGSKGRVDTLTYSEGRFDIIGSEMIYPGDSGTEEGRRRYEELFTDQSPN